MTPSDKPNPLLCLDGLTAHYGASQALFGVSLDCAEGEVVTLLGRNGMGKTTTIHSIMGIVRPSTGSVRFAGRHVERLPAYRIARLGLGLVPEGRQVFANLSVRENLIATAANRNARDTPWTLSSVFALFPVLAERQHQMGNLLSGGEQQMLAIARALLTNPKLLLLDEVTEGLAPLIRREIWTVIERLKETGHAILVVDKNIDELSRIADRHYVIEKGQIAWSGSNRSLLAQREILTRYVGV